MNRVIAWALLVFLFGCGQSQKCEETLAMDSLRRETNANLFRQKSECQAIAIEFNGDQQMVGNCLETYRLIAKAAQTTLSNIDKRYQESDITACKAVINGSKKYLSDEEIFGPNATPGGGPSFRN